MRSIKSTLLARKIWQKLADIGHVPPFPKEEACIHRTYASSYLDSVRWFLGDTSGCKLYLCSYELASDIGKANKIVIYETGYDCVEIYADNEYQETY